MSTYEMSEIDYSTLSDEELAKLDLSNVEVNWDNNPINTTQDEIQTAVEETDDNSDETVNEAVTQADKPSSNLDTQNTKATDTDDETVQTESDSDTNTDDKPAEQTDYQAFYEKLTKPFKANGREIQVQNADDMIALMQQGANYSKKMAQLKPNLALMRTLEQHGLNDADKITYLIDLYNKQPEAIAKLVKEADIDLYSFDTDQAEQYTPKTVVNEPSALEDTITELYGNHETFKDVVTDITTLWDKESKAIVSDNPEILRVMAKQADEGIYQQIMSAIDYEKMLGRLSGIPFLHAYEQVEARILQANQPVAKQEQGFTAPRPQANQEQVNSQNQAQKQRASVPKSSTSQSNAGFDPLKLSDEEFLKFYNQQKFH
ncbi:hypothetical protein [Moraxella catarrhalis]|uniref:hypothetical protein n=2 Tax=Moraxella catarrhalis TaxID=480 RepID=UPI00031B2288|nr:hypothetical protein [Moraxella catarrhalis]